MKRFKRYLVILFIVIFTANFIFAKNNEDDNNLYKNLELFTKVLSIVKKDYVEDKTYKDLIYGAINGMLSSLDPHSSFLPPDSFKEMQVETKGEFGGLGIVITIKDGILTVVSPIEDTPAYKAGIKAGDKILKINGESTRNLTLMEAVKKLRGKPGTKVTISIFREGFKKLKNITITRAIIKIKSVKKKMFENNIAYIRITQFQERTTSDLKKALKDLQKEYGKIKGLVLDLRNNPGGLLSQAVGVSDVFLKKGLIVYTKGRVENSSYKFFAHDDGDEGNYPIVIIVNSGTASASEIVSGALQDHKRAIIIGTQTFGKGSVQTIIPMQDGSAIRLTTAKYYTPSGRSIQAEGIKPDIIVPQRKITKEKNDDEFIVREKNLKGHFENDEAMKKKNEKKTTKKNKKIEKFENVDDYQLLQALEIVKALEIAINRQ